MEQVRLNRGFEVIKSMSIILSLTQISEVLMCCAYTYVWVSTSIHIYVCDYKNVLDLSVFAVDEPTGSLTKT